MIFQKLWSDVNAIMTTQPDVNDPSDAVGPWGRVACCCVACHLHGLGRAVMCCSLFSNICPNKGNSARIALLRHLQRTSSNC